MGGSAGIWGLASSCPTTGEFVVSLPLLIAKQTWCCFPASFVFPRGEAFLCSLGLFASFSLSLHGKGFCKRREGSLILPSDLRGDQGTAEGQ